ncbi:hypothetical protein RO3G_06832 [Rhizopus delemar RA 99-880]|uniref:Uncharacterized protein n=1 Tax=Rhizopus delemar (strain RA 99-880 / ATCC MYA-4621 / FGSC 9543 / NRRL 43880) TaxID=246409 RepID=I1C0Z7_RHIO9|nr:hypothetical protein RO3G_06832 [Rhizopus delemar RA 99-880]|eukprot:EIE82127.1 hypothetical protein RO3G_06832 [Rhizopus delemar RA 99-880]
MSGIPNLEDHCSYTISSRTAKNIWTENFVINCCIARYPGSAKRKTIENRSEDAYSRILLSDLQGFCRYSAARFEEYLNRTCLHSPTSVPSTLLYSTRRCSATPSSICPPAPKLLPMVQAL